MRAARAIDLVCGLKSRPRGFTYERADLGGFTVELVRRLGHAAPLSDGAILFLHGGAFVLGGLNTHRPSVVALASRTGLPVLHVDYRQLPEVSIEGSVRDCLRAYGWLLEQGASPMTTAFVGDSAGGLLAFATAARCGELGLPTPSGLVGVSPWLELDFAATCEHQGQPGDCYLPLDALRAVSAMNMALEVRSGRALPPMEDADLSRLPPTLLLVGECEALRSDSENMARRLAAVGVPCTLSVWPGQVHDFPVLLPGLPESHRAWDEVANFVTSNVVQLAHRFMG